MTAKAATSMKASLIVWDLETVPDIGGFAAFLENAARP
jgi:hypothetical protein